MDSFKDYLMEHGPAKKDAKKPTFAGVNPHAVNWHKNPAGDVKKMHSDVLHHEYNKLNQTRDHTEEQAKRHKELETERQNRGHKPRTGVSFWDNYQKVTPKPRLRWGDGKGGWKYGG